MKNKDLSIKNSNEIFKLASSLSRKNQNIILALINELLKNQED